LKRVSCRFIAPDHELSQNVIFNLYF
jgi:hypothetical protein